MLREGDLDTINHIMGSAQVNISDYNLNYIMCNFLKALLKLEPVIMV